MMVVRGQIAAGDSLCPSVPSGASGLPGYRMLLRLLGDPLSHEAERLERLNGILGAHCSPRLIAPEPAQYGTRLRQPEPAFDSTSLLEIVLRNGLPGIPQVRAHLVARAPC